MSSRLPAIKGIIEASEHLQNLAPKWSNIEFVTEQLNNHLEEVGELVASNDPHAKNELIDLALIACRLAKLLNEEGVDFPQVVNARLNKFDSKKHL